MLGKSVPFLGRGGMAIGRPNLKSRGRPPHQIDDVGDDKKKIIFELFWGSFAPIDPEMKIFVG
jgi:hypothetical protein